MSDKYQYCKSWKRDKIKKFHKDLEQKMKQRRLKGDNFTRSNREKSLILNEQFDGTRSISRFGYPLLAKEEGRPVIHILST